MVIWVGANVLALWTVLGMSPFSLFFRLSAPDDLLRPLLIEVRVGVYSSVELCPEIWMWCSLGSL